MKLEVKNLRKSFSDTEVLHGISFTIESGKALGFLGRNGAGKTTTIRILMDLFSGNSGEILLNGKKFVPKEHQIGYLPEERGLYPKQKVLEQLVYFGQLRGLTSKEAKENALYWLKRLGVEEHKNKKLETLSKGNQQKVQLAETFICNPDIVVLDEPFSGLDPVNSQILKDIIRELIQQNKLLIFSSHQMGYIEEFCENIALINKGEIVLKGDLKEIKKEYGMNRLTLSDVNLSCNELKEIFDNKLGNIATVVDEKKDYLIIELMGQNTKQDLLKALIELNIDIEKFSTYQPTLEDIFVKKVGDAS
ncbi:ATP-binding cassette domain-containing protein [Serpentinicella sp. ANB-PHB4]|uniref:ABC transporter ATP-binding protein n=1 Tax=Serpentinicella sp. ANB-PHB4 TaxID=3074076 RepID=UPI00285C450A|nr:ATP-binding cassette domain-containing protein [Serpentinicella sp. ANB-PHB4]MDR5659632.1 ATP-binding cassette domain-containing protein [Serpentinicella sp. ANB-PHB4]